MPKLVLIDRDGVINAEKEQGYVERAEELQIYPRALQAFALLKREGFTCVVVTNQSVVGRGRISKAQLDAIHEFLKNTVASHGGEIAEVISCTDRPDQATERRKPGPGMLQEAVLKYAASAKDTPMIGDAITDLQAAHAAGCRRFLVLTGKGATTRGQIVAPLMPVTICSDLLEAAQAIAGEK